MGNGEESVRCSDWKKSTAIDDFHRDGKAFAESSVHGWIEEAGEIIGNHSHRLLRQSFDQASAGCLWGFEEWVVGYGFLGEGFLVVDHAIEEEAMESIACPGVVLTYGFEDDEWSSEFRSEVGGMFQGEVVACSAVGRHPIQDPLPVRIWGVFVGSEDSRRWNHRKGIDSRSGGEEEDLAHLR